MQGFVCRIRSLNGVPCPFLISVAAKKNGPPATTDATTIFRVRFLSSLRQRRMASLQHGRGTCPCRNRRAATTSRIRFQSSLRQKRMVRLQHGRGTQAGTGCHEGGIILSKKPPECTCPCRNRRAATSSRYDEPHPILIFAAAKKNGPVLH